MIRYSYTGRGQCLGREWCHQYLTVDTEAAIVSGDAVLALVRDPQTGAVHQLVKYLETTRDGRWWLVCHEGVTLIGPYFVPAALEKIVARESMRLQGAVVEAAPPWQAADEATLKLWDEISLPARLEWTAHGKRWGVKFPGLDAIVSRPPEFCLPADFYGKAA